MDRAVFVAIALGMAGCTGAKPIDGVDMSEAVQSAFARDGELTFTPSPEPVCPPGTTREILEGEMPNAGDWWCMRGDVREGPFSEQYFDVRERTWNDVHGEYRDGQLHGTIEHLGFYLVEGSGHRRAFLREVHDHGLLVRGNQAEARVVLDAAHSTLTRRFMVHAAGLAPSNDGGNAVGAIGTIDVEAAATWEGGPADGTPSILRMEVSTPFSNAPRRTDVLLYVLGGPEPQVVEELGVGEVPTTSATWKHCEISGCEVPVDVTLHWLVPGPGRVEVSMKARAVPDTWPEEAPITVSSAK